MKLPFLLSLACLATLPFTGALAKTPVLPGSSHNNKSPIEITSDKLEVFQEENRATFTGHVVAIQGDVRLKADGMTVYYRQQDNGKKKSKDMAGDANAIRKIDAQGGVFLSTPEETASGASGTYD